MTKRRGDLSPGMVCALVHGCGMRRWNMVSTEFYRARTSDTDDGVARNGIDAHLACVDMDGILGGIVVEEIAGIDHHPLVDQYPCRTPVWWARTGEVRKDPGLRGVSGRRVVLRIPKQFGRIEGKIAAFLRAPTELKRPLDDMNSLLWELADGSRTFGELCKVMNDVFREEIAPVMQRTAAAIQQLKNNNLMLVLEEPLNSRWFIGPGKTPEHQTLEDLADDHIYDWSMLEGEAP